MERDFIFPYRVYQQIKKENSCFFMNGYFMSYIQYICGDSFTKKTSQGFL